MLRGLEAIIKIAMRLRQSLILFLDDDAGTYTLKRIASGAEFKLGSGDDAKQFIRDGKSRYQGPMGPLNIMHPRHGMSFKAPGDAILNRDPKLRHLLISNPESYYLAIQRNESQDALNANRENEHWITKVAPFAMVVLIVTFAMVGFLVWKLQGV